MTTNEAAQLKTGDSIKNKDPYEGEGELIICELGKQVKGVHSCNTKYPNLNGQVFVLCWEDLEYFEKVNDKKPERTWMAKRDNIFRRHL